MLNIIKSKLKKYGQDHLLNFYAELNEEEKKHLIQQIESIDFELLKDLAKLINQKKEKDEFKSIPSYLTTEEYHDTGLEEIKKGYYAVVTMAGGQGTRLGFDGPKGTYILEYGINKSLFEIQCDRLKNIYQKCNVYVPWYIMTSQTNNDETIDFFKKHNYFNYPKEKIEFFIQDELPMIDINGKIVMNSKFNIKMGANGSGGVFLALSKSGILDSMKKNNIKWVFIGGIDNILSQIDNPDLIGLAIKNNYLITSKTTPKKYPEEKVGVFAYRNNKPSVLEYIEMNDEMNNKRDKDGNLLYRDVHTIINLFHISILNKIADKSLPYVPAFKKAEYINDQGEIIIPEKENAYKFETFIFDGFSYVDEVGLIQGKREEVFAPIKNKDGVDSPKTASKLYLDYYK
ncbi:MAG: UTP--glucose-1-phosphate uridylyltransferase [Bacilli bacterium]|nr:UTP--glucose-1-phosphate uridylyltransferase [Bacilli bacterium]